MNNRGGEEVLSFSLGPEVVLQCTRTRPGNGPVVNASTRRFFPPRTAADLTMRSEGSEPASEWIPPMAVAIFPPLREAWRTARALFSES